MKVVRFAAAAGVVALIVYLMVVCEPILLPLVIAIFLWHLINALAKVSSGLRIGGRPVPAGLRLAGALVLVALLGWFVVNLVVHNVGQLMAAAPVYQQNLQQMGTLVAGWLGLEELPASYDLLEGASVTSMVREFTAVLMSMIGSMGTVAIYVVFLLVEQHMFPSKIAALFPDPGRQARVNGVLHRIGAEIQTYVWLKTLLSLLTAFLSYVVLWAVGVNMAGFWALLIFALNYIPYIGGWLGVILPTLLAMVQFGSLRPILLTFVALTLVQFSIGSILEPRIMGKGLNLSLVVMLLSLAVWGSIWGLVGMFLAVPLMVVIMIVCSQFEATRPLAIVISADGELKS
ncbi:MAG: AI-2E family transporter [Candidatus Polarisedimenticolia bacterium]